MDDHLKILFADHDPYFKKSLEDIFQQKVSISRFQTLLEIKKIVVSRSNYLNSGLIRLLC